MIKPVCGIYCLVCNTTGKRYVGSSVNCYIRCMAHFAKLRTCRHVNIYLQAAWAKHPEENWNVELLEICPRNLLKQREDYWIRHLKSGDTQFGFNLAPAVRQKIPTHQLSKIIKTYWDGLTEEQRDKRNAYKQTEKHRKRMRQNALDQWADPQFCKMQPIKISATMIEYCKDPEIRVQRKRISNEYWSRPEAKAKVSARMKKYWAEKRS